MGQTNTERIEHTVSTLPNTFRDDQLEQIVNDLNEEEAGKGFSEVLYSGVFVNQIIVWDTPSKIKKRTDTVFTYTGAFVTSIVKSIYNEDGTAVIATISATITYDANKKVVSSYVQTARV